VSEQSNNHVLSLPIVSNTKSCERYFVVFVNSFLFTVEMFASFEC